MNHQITKKTPLLAEKGHLTEPGYATRMNFVYNRESVRHFPLKLKEWNFYQIQKDHYVLQITIGHVSYMCSVSAALIDLNTGKRWDVGAMKPFYVPKLDRDPEGESVNKFRNKDLAVIFRVTENLRILQVKGSGPSFREVDICIELENDRNNEKMVIATPFRKPTQFYLNYKENYYRGTGKVRFDEVAVDFEGCTGLVDWGRGVWPYSHQWFWGSLTSHIDGVPFGFNIGWGFGDLSHATENVYFYRKKAYKVGHLKVERDGVDVQKKRKAGAQVGAWRFETGADARKFQKVWAKADGRTPWKFENEADGREAWNITDEQGKLRMRFTPKYDNYTENKFVVVDTHCHQVFGYFDGVIETDEGERRFEHMLGFIEHAVNRW